MKSKQECFDITCEHLMTQRVAAIDASVLAGVCAYRGPNGTMCAIGKWIEDDKYTPEMEGKHIDLLIRDFSNNLPAEVIKYSGLFTYLQIAHDVYLKRSILDCAKQLENIAQEVGLSIPECVKKELEAA